MRSIKTSEEYLTNKYRLKEKTITGEKMMQPIKTEKNGFKIYAK